MSFSLRPCQNDFIADIGAQYAKRIRRVVGVASTGFGKTACFAEIAKRAAAKGNRVIILAHRVEIVNQICAALDRLGVRHGRIQPGRTMTDDLIQCAMVQTLVRRMDRIAPPSLVVIDECHHAVAKSYVDICEAFPAAKVLGVTATPELINGRGLGAAFDAMVEAIPMSELISLGYLANYRYLAPPQIADFQSVKTRMGDYVIDDLAKAMDKAVITGSAIGEYRAHLSGRTAVAFCVNVEHSRHVAEEFKQAGIRAASVDGTMNSGDRARLINALGTGEIEVLTNCNIATEGTDIPAVGGAILLRPTKSLGLYLQMVGRCLRPKPDGSKAVIIDHVGNVHRHGLPAQPRTWSLDGKSKKAKNTIKTKTCETCYRVFTTAPGWQEEAECGGEPQLSTGCALLPAETAKPRTLEHRDGELSEITETPEWAGGINLLRAKGPEFKAMLARAKTREQLQEIAKARGYKRGWSDHILRQRQERHA